MRFRGLDAVLGSFCEPYPLEAWMLRILLFLTIIIELCLIELWPSIFRMVLLRIFRLFCHQFLDTIAGSFVDLTPQREARLQQGFLSGLVYSV